MQHQNGHSKQMIDATANQVNGSGKLSESDGAQWVGESLLEAMKHSSNNREMTEMDIQEDLNEEHAIERMTAPELRAYIDRQVNMCIPDRLSALEARLNHHIAVQEPARKTVAKHEAFRQLHDIENARLVNRMFHVSYTSVDSQTRLLHATARLRETSKINEILTAHLETVVVRMNLLQAQVNGLQAALQAGQHGGMGGQFAGGWGNGGYGYGQHPHQ